MGENPAIDTTDLVGGAYSFDLQHVGHIHVGWLGMLPADFAVRRFYDWNPGTERLGVGGFKPHAHRTENKVFWVIEGRINLEFHDGEKTRTSTFDAGQCVYIPAGVWHKMIFALHGTRMIVLTDKHDYDRTDYIESWSEFLAWKATQQRGGP